MSDPRYYAMEDAWNQVCNELQRAHAALTDKRLWDVIRKHPHLVDGNYFKDHHQAMREAFGLSDGIGEDDEQGKHSGPI